MTTGGGTPRSYDGQEHAEPATGPTGWASDRSNPVADVAAHKQIAERPGITWPGTRPPEGMGRIDLGDDPDGDLAGADYPPFPAGITVDRGPIHYPSPEERAARIDDDQPPLFPVTIPAHDGPELGSFDVPPAVPSPATAHALFAQSGDVIEWTAGARFRWTGQEWRPLQLGDTCRNARDGSAMTWTTKGWQAAHVSNAQVDDLARVLRPELANAVDRGIVAGEDIPVDVQWMETREAARRAIAHGYIHTLIRPERRIQAYRLPRIPAQVGDPVDVTWSDGKTTHHRITAVSPTGELGLRNLE